MGERQAVAAYNLLDDVLAVWPVGEDKVWNETLAERLAALRPEVYGGWGSEQVTTALKPHGVRTGDVWGRTPDGKGTTRRGITKADVVDTLRGREAR